MNISLEDDKLYQLKIIVIDMMKTCLFLL